MKKGLYCKVLAVGIIVLFVEVSYTSAIYNQNNPSVFLEFGEEETKCRNRNSYIDINSGLVGYWSFDFGNAIDESVNENHGVTHGTHSLDGISGKALFFDGEDDFVEILDTSDYNFGYQSISISAWIQLEDNEDEYRNFVSLGDAVDFYPNIGLTKSRSGYWDGRIFTQMYPSLPGGEFAYAKSIEDGNSLPKNEWLFLTSVIDVSNSLFKIYINGIFQDSVNLPYFDISESDELKLYFGVSVWPDPWWHGRHNSLIDEVRIYDRALSENEIKILYNNPGGLKETIIIGRISNLDRGVGNLNTFNANGIYCIQFSPFRFYNLRSGETIKISEEFRGLLNNNFAIGIFDAFI